MDTFWTEKKWFFNLYFFQNKTTISLTLWYGFFLVYFLIIKIAYNIIYDVFCSTLTFKILLLIEKRKQQYPLIC